MKLTDIGCSRKMPVTGHGPLGVPPAVLLGRGEMGIYKAPSLLGPKGAGELHPHLVDS